MTTSSPSSTDRLPLSAQLRAGTRAQHAEAEGSAFVARLFSGGLPLEAYVAMLEQLWHVYDVLEESCDALRDDPVVGAFVDGRLARRGRIETDVAALGGRSPAESQRYPATEAYRARIADHAANWPAGLVAHHYTRYLGDLSGGQMIRDVVRRTYGLADEHGTSFYDFPGIDDPLAFKGRYRATLDAAPWNDHERAALVAEVAAAYSANTSLFAALDQTFPT
jgi:heme oxygenase